MTLANIVLQRLGDAKPTAGRHELAFSDEETGWSLYLTVERADDISVMCWELSLRRTEVAGDVAHWANRIAECSTALEALKVVEIDPRRNQALLRRYR